MNRAPLFKFAVGAIAIALMSACSGPSTKINASMREFPQNVRIGDATEDGPDIAPIPPTAPLLSDGIFSAPEPTRRRGSLPEAKAPCPAAALGKTAALAVGVQVDRPPASGAYSYRTTGKHTVGGASASVVDYPPFAERLVGPARPTALPGGLTFYDFEVLTGLGQNRTITTYRVIPKPAGDATPAQNPVPGMYVVRVATLDALNSVTASFSPEPPMLVVPFPAFLGRTFHVASVDAVSGVAVTYRGAVGRNVSVDACGEIVDTRRVKHTGSITVGGCGPSLCDPHNGAAPLTTTFSAVYDLALQYGGLSVQDAVHIEGGSAAAPYVDDMQAVISTLPKQPK